MLPQLRNDLIRQLREEQKTCAEIARICGISPQRVSQIIARRVHRGPYQRSRYVGRVYFIRVHNYIKVGITKNIESRLEGIRSQSPYDPELLLLITGGRELEAWIHNRLLPHRHRLEWFHATPEVYALIEALRPDTTTCEGVNTETDVKITPTLTDVSGVP